MSGDQCRACDRRAVVCEICGLCEDCHEHPMRVRFEPRRTKGRTEGARG